MNQRINKTNLKKLISLSKRYAPVDLYYKVREKLSAPFQEYSRTYQSYFPSVQEQDAQRRQHFSYAPLISVVVPTYETEELFLRQMIDSVIAQTYENWELCIADGSQSSRVELVIKSFYPGESRIKYKKLEKNAGISENTNQGIAMAAGDYIGLLDHDDLLAPSALYEMAARINDTGADMLYSDEDKIFTDVNCHTNPHFKLDFNRELLLGNNYICHFLVLKQELLKQGGGLDGAYNGAQDFDLVLRLSELAERIEHIPKILYHWRMHTGSTAGNTDSKPYAFEAGKRAVEASLSRNSLKGTVIMEQEQGFYRTAYEVPKGTTLGICCWEKAEPEKESEKQSKKAANGTDGYGIRPCPISEKWKDFIYQELSGCRVNILWDCISSDSQFQQADYVLFLCASVKKIRPGSIARLVGSCARPGVGIVGSKVISGSRVLQCGYWHKGGSWEPRFEGLPRHFKGYYRRAYLPVEVDGLSLHLAVTKVAGLKEIGTNGCFLSQDGSHSSKHPAAEVQPTPRLQSLELCSQMKEAGYKVIADPAAEVRVHEE